MEKRTGSNGRDVTDESGDYEGGSAEHLNWGLFSCPPRSFMLF